MVFTSCSTYSLALRRSDKPVSCSVETVDRCILRSLPSSRGIFAGRRRARLHGRRLRRSKEGRGRICLAAGNSHRLIGRNWARAVEVFCSTVCLCSSVIALRLNMQRWWMCASCCTHSTAKSISVVQCEGPTAMRCARRVRGSVYDAPDPRVPAARARARARRASGDSLSRYGREYD